MSLPAGSRGGTFLCPTCKSPLTVSVGGPIPTQPTASQSAASQSTWDSLPPPVRPSAQATQQGGHVWREATEQFVDTEQRRLREEAKRYVGRNSPGSSGAAHRSSRSRSSSGPWSGCFIAGGIVGGLGILAVIAIVAAFMFLGGPTEIALEGYKVMAKGSRRMERSEGDSRTVGVENRFTKSGFLIVSRTFPAGVTVDLDGYIVNLRNVGVVSEVAPIQKLGLDGIRYRFSSNSKSSPPHIGEIFDLGSKVLVLMYLPGDQFLRLQGRTSRYSAEQQAKIDLPEEFFASLQKAN